MKLNDVRTKEEGSILILALAFLMLFALLVPALLGLADTSILATERLAERRAKVYAADAAMETAIQNVRGGCTGAGSGLQCTGWDPTVPNALPCPSLSTDQVNTTASAPLTVTVKCSAVPGSGAVSSDPNAPPDPAIQTLSTATGKCLQTLNGKKVAGTDIGERGIVFKAKNAKYSVIGGMISKTTICQQGDNSTITTLFGANQGTCVVGYPKSSISPACVATPAGYQDPGYTPQVNLKPGPPPSIPTRCPTGSRIVKILPGSYKGTNFTALKNLFDPGKTPSCKGGIFEFTPGTYYFDNIGAWNMNPDKFHNPTPPDTLSNVVAGAPKGWNDDPAQATRPKVPFPGGCMLAADGAGPSDGVQFILGGNSQITLGDRAIFEFCPPAEPVNPRISVFQAHKGENIGGIVGPKPTDCNVKPYPGAGSCVSLKINSKNAAIWGTVYAPSGVVTITKEFSVTVLNRGVIARTIWIQAVPKKTVPVIAAVPPNIHLDRDVIFTACIAGMPQLNAEATFHDQGGTSPGDSVDIDEWTVEPSSASVPCT